MTNQDTALMAHLLRRAGFGATPDELDQCMAKGYDAVVEELLFPSDPQNIPDDLIRRYITPRCRRPGTWQAPALIGCTG